MTIQLFCQCPKCDKERLEFNFASNNGYVALCGTCKGIFYYCSILGKMDFFEMTEERFEKQYSEFDNQ